MSTLRVSFFLFVFLFHSFAFSQAVTEDTAEVIFTDFATDLLLEGHIANASSEFDSLTESSWSNDIAEATENWTADEAREFLSVLQSSGIEPNSLLNILLSTDYLKALKEKPAFRFSTEPVNSERLTAGEVFFNYVDNHLGTSEIEDRMGSEWLTLIVTHTENWTDRDATDFLNFLETSEVQLESILNLLQATGYLQKLKSEQIDLTFLNSSNTVVVESTAPSENQQSPTELQNTVSDQSAGDIFIERARQYFRAEFEAQKEKKYKNMTYEEAFQKKMGSTWEDKLQRYTKNWTPEDARAFLSYLSNRIGEEAALNRIKHPSYFNEMRNYNRFLEYIVFYENYIGEDGVTYRLNRSLNGFGKGDFVEIEKVIEFLEKYLGSREFVEGIMMENLEGFSLFSSRPTAQTNLENLKDVIAYLESIGITEAIIKPKLIGNFVGFVKATRKKLETRRQSLTKPEAVGIVFTYDEINKIVIENMQGFLRADLKKVKKMIIYLKDKTTGLGLEDKQVKEMAIGNLQGLALSDPETLEYKRQSLTKPETIGIAFTLDEVNQVIEESIQGFLQAHLKKVKKMVTYLKDKNTGLGLEDKQVKEMAIRNLQGLALSDPETLEYKRQSLIKPETIGIAFTSAEINKMIIENMKDFISADLEKVEEMVTYLKDKNTGLGLEDKQVKEMAIGNLQGLALSDPETLEYKRQSLTKPETIGIAFTLDEVNQMIVENIEDFLQVDLKKVKKMVTYLKDKNTGLGVEDEQVKEMAIGNLKGLALSDPETLEYKRQSLTKPETIGIAFTLDEINQMIAKNIEGFLRVDLKKVKKMVTYLKDKTTGLGLEDKQVKEMAVGNLLGLALSDPETLEYKRQSLTKPETIGIAFTLDEVNQMIAENIEDFLRVDLKKIKKMVTYLKNKNTGLGLKDKQVKEMAIRNLKGLALSDPQTLKDKMALLTKPETIGIAFTLDEVNKMIAKSIEGFLHADLKKVEEMVTYLKDKNTGLGLEEKQVKEMAIRNLKGFSTIKSDELKNMIESLKQQLQLSKAKEKTLITEIREMIVTQNLIDFYYNFDANLKTLICTQSLSN